jgi:hypothetical protein
MMREFTFGIAVSGIGLDEPDAVLVENFTCNSVRNYINYCNEPLGALIETQSSELDPKKRRAQVADILKRLEGEAARPVVAWLMSPFVHWPHVKASPRITRSTTSGACRTSGSTARPAARSGSSRSRWSPRRGLSPR